MIKHFLKISVRQLIRNKVYTSINILGLTIGITCAIAIFIWINHELSFDTFHENASQIHQTYFTDIKSNDSRNQYTVSPIIAGILESEFPEVISTTRRAWLGSVVLRYGDKIFEEKDGCAADPSMFDMLSYKFKLGNTKNAFKSINSVVLTESIAKKYFGHDNPMGKFLVLNKEHSLEVTGVIEDLPPNTEFRFDFLTPLLFSEKLGQALDGEEFFPCDFLTFVRLKNKVSLEELNKKIQQRIRLDLDNRGITFAVSLIPITDIHLLEFGGKQRIYIFSIIGVVILIIACFNFMNLSIALSTRRAKEIGVRKVAGSGKAQLIVQFFGESFIIVFIAIDLALILINPLISYFNQITNSSVPVNPLDPHFLMIIGGILLFTVFFTGFYPAMYLSSFKPLSVFKANFATNKTKSGYRKYFIAFQFATSILFLTCTIVMQGQLNKIKNFNYGLHKQDVIYTHLDEQGREKFLTLKQELLKVSGVSHVSTSSNLPTMIEVGNFTGWGINDGINRRILETWVGLDYLELFDLHMREGRFYSKDFGSDLEEAIIINETAIKKVGIENGLEQPFFYQGENYKLIGIMKDFQHQSAVNKIPEPVIFRLSEKGQYFLFLRLYPSIDKKDAIIHILESVKNTMATIIPDSPIELAFLDEQKTGNERLMETRHKMIFFVSILSISIACLGLLGLSALMNEKRTKEIGIRKVLGASTSQISLLLSKEFIVIALLANIVAWPIAWFAMDKWLQNFKNRIDLTIWPFLLGGTIALMIAILTVSSQAIRSATANPIDSLRDE